MKSTTEPRPSFAGCWGRRSHSLSTDHHLATVVPWQSTNPEGHRPNQPSYRSLNPDPSSAPAAQVLPPKVVNALRTPSDKDSNKENGHNLCMQAISFGYKMADGTVFNVMDNLDLSFQLGHHYAIMGETGAGKSTIFKILAGLLQPVHGRIVVNGKAVDPTSRLWREQVGVVSQDSVLFNRTIRENLEY